MSGGAAPIALDFGSMTAAEDVERAIAALLDVGLLWSVDPAGAVDAGGPVDSAGPVESGVFDPAGVVAPAEDVDAAGTPSSAGAHEPADAVEAPAAVGLPALDAPASSLSTGVVHVVAAWRDAEGALRVLRIEERTPKSDHDLFLLNAARARVEGIVTTGAILRSEPGVRWVLRGPGHSAVGLEAWRRRRWGLSAAPWLAILTSGRGLDPAPDTARARSPAHRHGGTRSGTGASHSLLDHPGLREGVQPLLVTGRDGAARLAAAAAARGIEVEASDEPGLDAALEALRRRGARSISVEAGPSTARALYCAAHGERVSLSPAPLVDELWLSTFLGTPPSAVVGPALLSAQEQTALIEPCGRAREVEEPSGRWRFQRLRPRAGATRAAPRR